MGSPPNKSSFESVSFDNGGTLGLRLCLQLAGKLLAGPKAVAIALHLDEDYDIICRDTTMKAHFARLLEGDISKALEVARWRISVADLCQVSLDSLITLDQSGLSCRKDVNMYM